MAKYCRNFKAPKAQTGRIDHLTLKNEIKNSENSEEHLAPTPKEKSVSFPLPEIIDTMDASKAASSVLTAVSDGEITPIEGTRVRRLINSYRRTLEMTEIEERLQVLEQV